MHGGGVTITGGPVVVGAGIEALMTIPTTDPVVTDPTDPSTDPVVEPVVVVPTDLGDLIEALEREVALPGAFLDTYPDVTEDGMLLYLGDAFAEAQLDGFFPTHTLDVDAGTVSPPLSVPARALVVIYAGIRWVRTEIRSQNTSSRYKAGPVEYEVQQGATVLLQLLKDFSARKAALMAQAATGAAYDYVLDSYHGRQTWQSLGTFAPLELPYPGGYIR